MRLNSRIAWEQQTRTKSKKGGAVAEQPEAADEIVRLRKEVQLLKQQMVEGKRQQHVDCRFIQSLQDELMEVRAKNEELNEKNKKQESQYTVGSPVSQRRTKPELSISPSLYSIRDFDAEFEIEVSPHRSGSLKTLAELAKIKEVAKHALAESMLTRFRKDCQAKDQYFNSPTFASDLITLCERTIEILSHEDRLLNLQSPSYIFGDIHGNLSDLTFFQDHLWTLGMGLTAGTFVFLGDYVDRGAHGLEVVAYLFAQKIIAPEKMFLLRGNHETRVVNGNCNYYQEASFRWQCCERWGADKGNEVWEAVNLVFDHMPMSAVVDDRIFCTHGGIPRLNGTDRLQAIRDLPCPAGICPRYEHESAQNATVAMDLVWSDPADEEQEKTLDETGFGESHRGQDVKCFGRKAAQQFLESYDFKFLIRAHQAHDSGINISKGARVITVFSTSKDHGCGDNATCGCLLVDNNRIQCINRSPGKTAAIPEEEEDLATVSL